MGSCGASRGPKIAMKAKTNRRKLPTIPCRWVQASPHRLRCGLRERMCRCSGSVVIRVYRASSRLYELRFAGSKPFCPRRAAKGHGEHLFIREGSLRDAKNTFLSTMGRFEVRSKLGASTRAPTRGAPTEVGAGARNRPFWIHEGPRRATENTFLIREGSLRDAKNTFLSTMGRFEVRSKLGASTRAPTRGAPTEVGAGARNRPFWIHEGPRRATENTFLIREGSLRDAKNTFLSTMGRFEVRSRLGASTRAPTRGAPTEVGAGARNCPFWIHEGGPLGLRRIMVVYQENFAGDSPILPAGFVRKTHVERDSPNFNDIQAMSSVLTV